MKYQKKPLDVEKLKQMFYERSQKGIEYTLDELFWDVCQYIYLDNDRDFFEAVLVAVCDRKVKGEPIWLYGIAESGGTKSAMSSILDNTSDDLVYGLDSLTEHTLVSGHIRFNLKTKKHEPVKGLLPQIDGKVLVIKDFTWILSLHPNRRKEIFGQLRTIYDGYVNVGYGTTNQRLTVNLKSGIGLIAFTTPMIDDYAVLEAILGSRFLRIRHKTEGFQKEMEKKAMENFGFEREIYKCLGWLVYEYIRRIDWSKDFRVDDYIDDYWKERIRQLAEYVAFMRSQARGQWFNGQLQAVVSEPTREVGTRLIKQFLKFGLILTVLRKKQKFGKEEWKTLLRVAEDTIMPYTRSRILKLILKYNYKIPYVSKIAKELKTSRTHIRTTLQMMEACYIVEVKNDYATEITKDNDFIRYVLTKEAKEKMQLVYETEMLKPQQTLETKPIEG